MKTGSRVAGALCYVWLAIACDQALAQSKYPSRPIRIVVPYTPGGITDVTIAT